MSATNLNVAPGVFRTWNYPDSLFPETYLIDRFHFYLFDCFLNHTETVVRQGSIRGCFFCCFWMSLKIAIRTEAVAWCENTELCSLKPSVF